MLDCRIIKLRNGEVVALNQDGTPSKLYREALAYTGDVQKALDLWQTAYTDEFQLEYKSNTDDSAVLNDVLKFLDTNDATTSTGLSAENRAELVSVMQQFGYKRLSKLYKDLHAIYKAKGVLDMDGSKAVSTGLYTINDVYELDVDSVRDIISQIEKQGLIADIQLEDAEPYTNIIDSSRKNILGASERISEQEAENILKQEITDFSSKEDIENVIRNSDFSEHFSGRKRDALVKKFGTLKRIPEVFIAEDGTLSATDRSLYNEVANTFPGDLSFEDLKPLKADVKYFKELSDKTWNENTDKVVNVLKEVEQKAANIGLDLVGISEKPGDREKVIELIDSVVKLLEKPSDKGLLNAFVANKSELIPATSKGYIIELSPKYRSYNVVRVNTNLSDGEMFDRHSLLKLSDNLYHIVNTKNKSEFYENLYQKLVDKKLKGVKTKDVTNKVQTLKDLEAFVMSRSVGFEVSNKEEASLAQLIFEHDSFPVREDFSALANIKTPEDYLKTDFVLDFYKYVVEEKLKNSSVYRNTLSAFVFSDNDISINRPIKSIEGLKYSEELKDYFSIKKDLSLNNLFKGESNVKLTADVKQFNNPNSVKEFQGTKYETKGYVIADESVDNILKVDGVLYKRAKGNVFAKITNIDTNYYSTNIAAPFEEETVNKLNESSKIAFTKKEKPLEKVVEETKTTTEVTPVQPTNKQITKYVSQYLKDNLGSDISIMSEADMKRELAKRGYDSIQTISTNDKVYGFYDENTKQIFLNESFLTSNSLIHEHWHAFKPILKDLANKGDLQAKLLIDTFRNTVDKAGVFNQAEFEARYDAQNQQKGTDWKSREELTIKREKLNDLIKEAALDLKAGRITNEDFREVVKQNSTIAPITNFIAPATKEQIINAVGKRSDKVDQPVEEGRMVALRIDIPSLDRKNTWVVTVHEAKDDKDRKGTPINYTNVARIKNVTFNTSATTALNIATGGEKNSIIRMNGNWSELPGESFEDKGINAQKIVEEIKDNPEWVQVGSNPYRHSYFYDRNNGVPVINAEEVVQIGGLVYAKNVTYGDVNSPEFTVKGLKDAAGKPVQFSILGEEGAQELDKYDESLSRLGQLELARKMKKDGQDPFSIRMATGWELNTVTDKWQYEIQPNMSIRKGIINNNNVFPGTTLEDLIDYPELFKAYPNLKNIEIKAVPYDEVDFEANYKPISNVIEISNYLLDETSKRLNPVLLHEIQHAIQVAEGYSPTSSQDIEEYINTIQNIGLKSEYSDIQDNSEEILFETLGYFKEAYKSVEEYVYNPWSQNITNTLNFFFKNIHGINVKTPKTIKSYSINGDRVYSMDEVARETEDSSKGIIEGLNKEIAILLERNSVSSEKDLNQQLNTEKDEERLDDLNSTKRVLNNIKNRISEVENGNFKVETTEDSPELELQDLLEAYNNQNNTSLTQDDVINDITSYVENNRKDEDDIYYRSQSEVEARNIEERMNLSPEDRRMFVLSYTEDVDRADQLNISNGILGDMYSKISNVFSSEVYNPRSGESKEDYIERMREEIEANLLGENSEAYFERIATENNLTEEAKKSFKEKLKKFVKIFSDWLARQLGFNNITPAEAAKLTTTDVLDRVTTSMLRGDFRPEELVKNKLKNAKAKASELQASKDSGLEIITPVDLQNIEECT